MPRKPFSLVAGSGRCRSCLVYKGSESLYGPGLAHCDQFQMLGTGSTAGLRVTQGGKGRMSNKVDIFGSSATLSPDVFLFLLLCYFYTSV